MDVQRPAGQDPGRQPGHLPALDAGPLQVGDLGRVQVPGSGQHDPVLRDRPQPEPRRSAVPAGNRSAFAPAARPGTRTPRSPASARPRARRTTPRPGPGPPAATRPPCPARCCSRRTPPPAPGGPNHPGHRPRDRPEHHRQRIPHLAVPGQRHPHGLVGRERQRRPGQGLVQVVGTAPRSRTCQQRNRGPRRPGVLAPDRTAVADHLAAARDRADPDHQRTGPGEGWHGRCRPAAAGPAPPAREILAGPPTSCARSSHARRGHRHVPAGRGRAPLASLVQRGPAGRGVRRGGYRGRCRGPRIDRPTRTCWPGAGPPTCSSSPGSSLAGTAAAGRAGRAARLAAVGYARQLSLTAPGLGLARRGQRGPGRLADHGLHAHPGPRSTRAQAQNQAVTPQPVPAGPSARHRVRVTGLVITENELPGQATGAATTCSRPRPGSPPSTRTPRC